MQIGTKWTLLYYIRWGLPGIPNGKPSETTRSGILSNNGEPQRRSENERERIKRVQMQRRRSVWNHGDEAKRRPRGRDNWGLRHADPLMRRLVWVHVDPDAGSATVPGLPWLQPLYFTFCFYPRRRPSSLETGARLKKHRIWVSEIP